MLYESNLETHIYFIFTDFSNRKKDHKKIPCTHTSHKYKTFLNKKKPEESRDPPQGREFDCRLSVHDFWVTIVTLQLSEDVIGVLAAEVAEAGLDPQHLPCESHPVRTLELHVNGFGLVGDAAAFVCADAAVFGPVRLPAGAARDGEV